MGQGVRPLSHPAILGQGSDTTVPATKIADCTFIQSAAAAYTISYLPVIPLLSRYQAVAVFIHTKNIFRVCFNIHYILPLRCLEQLIVL